MSILFLATLSALTLYLLTPPIDKHAVRPPSMDVGDPGGALEAQHQREMVRLHTMWQNTKEDLAAVKAELSRVQASQAPAAADAAMASMQSLTVELRDKCRFTELQLAGAREECSKLSSSSEVLRQQLAERESQLAEMSSAQSQQLPMLHELQGALQRLGQEKQRLEQQLAQERRELNDDAAGKEQALLLQEQKLHAMGEELRRSVDAQRSSQAAVEQANARAVELERTNGELGRQLLACKEQLKYLHLARRSEAQVQALLQQLQLDNTRLVKLLASTEEYKEFVAYAEDSGGLTYVPPTVPGASDTPKKGGGDGSDLMPRRERAVRGSGTETEYWVPSDTYALANDFRRTHMPHLPMELFAELLLRLNRVWRARETKRLERQRGRAQKKIGELRRRISQTVPYEEVLQSSEMERLRRELKEMRVAFNSGRRKLNETEEKLLESSLESAIAIDAQLQHQTRQNEQLLAELAEHELRFASAFGHGASVASSSAAEISDRFAERLTELMRDFQRKALQFNRTDPDLYTKVIQLQSWLLEGIDRRLVQCREKMASVYDGALSAHEKMGPPASARGTTGRASEGGGGRGSRGSRGSAARTGSIGTTSRSPMGAGGDDSSDEFD